MEWINIFFIFLLKTESLKERGNGEKVEKISRERVIKETVIKICKLNLYYIVLDSMKKNESEKRDNEEKREIGVGS